MAEWSFNENDKEDYTHYAVIPSEERNLTQGFSFPEEFSPRDTARSFTLFRMTLSSLLYISLTLLLLYFEQLYQFLYLFGSELLLLDEEVDKARC